MPASHHFAKYRLSAIALFLLGGAPVAMSQAPPQEKGSRPPATTTTPTELLKRLDTQGLAAKYHIDPSKLQPVMLITIDGITPEAPQQGDDVVVKYTVTNYTFVNSHGTVSGEFQHQPLLPVSGAAGVALNLTPGQATSGKLHIHPTSVGMSEISVRYRDETNCRDNVPDGRGGRVVVCQNANGAEAVADLNIAPNVSNTDADQDGMLDGLEDEMLARYRPFYRFSWDGAEEPIRPTDPIWYVRHSSLLTDGNESSQPVVLNAELQTSPLAVLTAKSGSSNFIVAACTENYFLNPANDYRSGFYNGDGTDWPGVIQQGNVGLYGHVRPDPNVAGLYRVEYWQFYGFNDANAPSWYAILPADLAALKQAIKGGDHEGDWEWITVLVKLDPATGTHQAVGTIHYVHGKAVEFDSIPAALPSAVSVSNNVGVIKELHGPGLDTLSDNLDLNEDADLAKVQNKLLQLFCPTDDECTHPVVYIEWGTHASWPTDKWSYLAAPKHNGSGKYQYLTAPPPNLGEVNYPRITTPGAAIILQYDGHWGAFGRDNSPPHGPAQHKSWTRPSLDPPDPSCLE